ncbi:MAG TPA: hypothetical protein VMZ71_17700 [Gemmataceae bacterium]|nr:hypothetical protein [Gemmataceae bacterium]
MLLLSLALFAPAADPVPALDQPPNTWVKRSPLDGGPPSPGLGYEGSLVWDSKHRRLIRFAGHNQGGGGEQNAETWAFDPLTAKWQLKEPNTSPPGACCNQQNVFDADQGRFVRFPAFSGSHGWQWFREIYLSNSTAWNYDLGTNTWRDRRPLPAPRVAPLRCASWDGDYQVAVVFGGEGSNEGTLVYDPYTNTWHRLNPKVQPEPRSGGNMAYDAAAKVHILFGTQFGNDPRTWAFDLRRNEWTDRKPAAQPPTDRNDPVLAYDPNARKVVALVRVVDKSEDKEVTAGHVETWAYDSTANTWAKQNPGREPDGWSNRSRALVAVPELNVLLAESVVNPAQRVKGVDREQQIWTYRTAAAAKPAGLPPPTNVRVRAEKGAAVVEWDRVIGADGYVLLRGTGDTPWAADYKAVGKIGIRSTEFTDREVPRGKVAYYRVKAVAGDGAESSSSPVARAQPRPPDNAQVNDMAPEPVRVYATGTDRVSVHWFLPREAGVTHHVERAPVEVFSEDQIRRLKTDTPPLAEPSVGAVKKIGPFRRITKEPLSLGMSGPAGATWGSFNDPDIDLTKPTGVKGEALYTHRFADNQLDPNGKPYRFGVYAYRVIAVNALGVESGPSAWALTIPPAPEHVYAKEDGEKCHVKWRGMSLDGISGYRVYRMNGPKVNGPGQTVTRLTADPVHDFLDKDGYHSFSDGGATKGTKRYWVVAVDKLGQEGVPSAPVWHWRQFRTFYQPFTGEWHQ